MTRPRPRDEGTVLILVLVLMVIGSLIVLPLLDYAMAVGRHNAVLTSKVKRQEAVKAGLRTALAEPEKLYEHCAMVNGELPGPGMDIDVATTCDFISFSLADNDDDLHLGLVATRVGELIPPGMTAIVEKDANGQPVLGPDGRPKRFVFEPQTAATDEWLDPSATWAISPTSEPKRIWAPNLPTHALNVRSADGFEMPSGYPDCTVYFPGTYADAVTLDGPTYFASGIYYFEQPVTVEKDADVVVGMGQNVGCTTDQEAAFYAVNAPPTHNISGLGGTFVFGHDGRLVVTNAEGAPKIRFNQRYVNASDTGGLPSFGVSIMSVNGKEVAGPDAQNRYVLDELLVPGVNEVPASVVGMPDGEAPPVPAGSQNYRASKLTHEPVPPTPPRDVRAIPLRTGTPSNAGAARVTWTEPEKLNGSPIAQYVVTADPGGATCSPTTMPLECIVTGLTMGQTYTFTVTASHAPESPSAPARISQPSEITSDAKAKPQSSSPEVKPPAAPAAPTAVRYADGTGTTSVLVAWTAPLDNNAPISTYTVTASPAIDPVTKPCQPVSTTSCLITDLPVFDADDPSDPSDAFSDYTFTASATNERGTSAASPASTLQMPQAIIPPAAGTPPAVLPPVPPVVVLPYEPDPIVDIDLPTTNPAVVDIPGYVAVPQGIFRIDNPHGLGTDANPIKVSGGVLAAAFRGVDGRATPTGSALTVPIGLVNPIVQRTFRIVSETTSGSPKVVSTAVVQINQNGAYAINSWEVQ